MSRFGGWHAVDIERDSGDSTQRHMSLELFMCSEDDPRDCKCVERGEEMTDELAEQIGLTLI